MGGSNCEWIVSRAASVTRRSKAFAGRRHSGTYTPQKARRTPCRIVIHHAKQDARQRGNLPTSRYTPRTQPTHAKKSSKPVSKRAVRAQGLAPLLRNRTTLEHIPPTRAQVGATLPTTRRTRTARPAQNPQTPAQKNRPHHRTAGSPTPPENRLRTPTPCPPPRPTRHSPLPPPHPPHHNTNHRARVHKEQQLMPPWYITTSTSVWWGTPPSVCAGGNIPGGN
jgi:hypothetical protein